MSNFGTMNVSRLTVVSFLMATSYTNDAQAEDVSNYRREPLSVSELKQVAAPRVYSVMAYVVHKDDTCPPCPPKALCETCVLGIYLADNGRPRKRGELLSDGIYLRTNKAADFQVGIQYLFKIRYRLEKTAAGAWLQTGPELIGFRHIDPGNKPE